MIRFTTKLETGFIVANTAITPCEDGFCGEAIDKLAKFEELAEGILLEQAQCSKKLEELRLAGKEKTVQFKELMIKKLNNVNMIATLKVLDLI